MTATPFRIVAPRGRPAISVVAHMIGVLRRPWATGGGHGLSYFHLWGFDDSGARARQAQLVAEGRRFRGPVADLRIDCSADGHERD